MATYRYSIWFRSPCHMSDRGPFRIALEKWKNERNNKSVLIDGLLRVRVVWMFELGMWFVCIHVTHDLDRIPSNICRHYVFINVLFINLFVHWLAADRSHSHWRNFDITQNDVRAPRRFFFSFVRAFVCVWENRATLTFDGDWAIVE